MKLPYFFVLLLCSFSLFAQEQLGLRLDNFAATNTLLINPANSLNSPYAWDINLGEASFFIANNYVFLEETKVFEMLRRSSNVNVLQRPDIEAEINVPPETLIADFFDDNKKRYVNISGRFLGPSALVQLRNRQMIGVITGARMGVSAQKMSTTMSYYTYYNRPFEEEFTILPFQGTVMTWTELGLHYGKGFLTYNGQANLGLTVKFLQGYESAFFKNNRHLRYTKFPENVITTDNTDVEFAYTKSNTTGEDVELQRNGVGVAFDIGFNMLLTESDEGYKWKIGLALLDIGQIRFNKNTEQHRVQTGTLLSLDVDDYGFAQEIEDLDEVIALFSANSLGDAEASLVQQHFIMGLPAALSLQVDYALNEFFYLNATMVQRLRLHQFAMSRGNMVALTARFESRWVSAALPLVFYNEQNLRIGVALRLAFLTIGSDHLLSWFRRSDFSSTDLYIALKVNPFRIGFNQKGKRNRGKVKCYTF